MSEHGRTKYDAERRPEHSTLGDSMDRFRRDPDAYTAGAQAALDRLLHDAERTFTSPLTVEIVDRLAANVLAEVHELWPKVDS